ncbi:MAG: ThuA domain-containing protein, partial [bacterium]|nr:ThuA domain-containing protein [bacterium]
MNLRMRTIVTGLLCVVCLVSLVAEAQPADRAKIRALIFSGRNNHDWKTTTPCLQKMYEGSGRFTVDVTDDPSTCTDESLAKYDVIVDNWSAFPEMTGRQWGETAENAVLDFIRGGKGFVVIHAATACFEDWPEFLEIAACAWRENAGHGQHHA